MHYQGTVIRPPSEAHSLIVQVALGCPHNRCAFCGTYRDKQYQIRPKTEIDKDLDFAARHCQVHKTVFLADGDVLALGAEQLGWLLGDIRKKLPWVRRVSVYGRAASILKIRENELATLKQQGLGRVYMGLESGHEPTLKAMNKGVGPEAMIRAGQRVRRAGIFLSVTCLLGIGGVTDSLAHARATARVLTEMTPSQIAVLTLMILENTELATMIAQNRFRLPDPAGLLRELRELVRGLGRVRCQFQANHASNYLNLDGRLPRDRNRFLALIDQALSGTLALRPESVRAL